MTIHHHLILTSLLVFSAGISPSRAHEVETNADDYVPQIKLEPAAPVAKNRIGLSYRMGLNITVDFNKLGGLALSDPGPATGSAVNRNYDNGYNRVDSSGNSGGRTWYWGYQSSQSVQGGDLVLQSYATRATASSKDRQEDPQHGFEFNYQRELLRKDHWRLGAEAALGYSHISIIDDRTLHNAVYRTNDTFALNGVIPPNSPYNGTFEGPGPIISSEPSSRTTDLLVGAATITGKRELEAHVVTLRLGPYLELPVTDRFSVFFNGGLTLGVGHTTFSFNETVVISDPAYDINLTSGRRSGSGSQTDFLIGGYAGAGLSYALTEDVSLFTSAIYQAAGRTIDRERGKESILDLGQSVIVAIGVSYSF